MSDNNDFLSNYNKNRDEVDIPSNKVTVKDADLGYKYEQKSGFKKHERKETALLPVVKNKPKFLIPAVAGGIAVIGIILVLVLLLSGGIKVIDLTGWALSDAQLWANENGIRLKTQEEYNDVYSSGCVILQDIAPGDSLRKGDFLKLTVSLGHDLSVTLPLPDLTSMTKDEIESWAAENFMTKVRITTEYNDTVASGKVIRFEINDNTVLGEVRRDTPVYIIISKGPKDESVVEITVPDFKTMPISECYVFASDNGIVLSVEERYDDYVPKGSIISQSVKAEEKIGKGDEIRLIVSKGPLIKIPDFSSYSKETGSAVAAQLNIPVTILEKYSGSSAGAFVSQSIKAGSVYEEGDILELYYSLGNKIVLPSFIGQTRDAIESWAKDLNDQGARIAISPVYTQSNYESGTIIHQDKANTVIGVKTTINITVSVGKVIYVPDFVAPEGSGYDNAITREIAIAMCQDIGIVPVFVEESALGRLPGEIWYQSIAAGAEVMQGSEITLKFAPANVTVNVPNFVGKTQAEARSYFSSFSITFTQAEEYVEGFAGKICRQSLRAYSTVAAGSAITLSISPDPPPAPSE
ncbi:MAG: PASTA domain-containing protein [Christensenellales bacterium]|jgi:beta-lactam-binding protein with PASTA domain